MGEIKSFRDLAAWQRAMDLASLIYKVTSRFPDSERFGLTSQLRRAAVSVPSNIAEGYGRGTRPDYLRFLRASRGSLFEIETQATLAHRFEYIPAESFEAVSALSAECGRILAGLIRSLDSDE